MAIPLDLCIYMKKFTTKNVFFFYKCQQEIMISVTIFQVGNNNYYFH